LLRPEVQRHDLLSITRVQRGSDQRRHGPRPRVEQLGPGQDRHALRRQPGQRQIAVFIQDDGLAIGVDEARAPEAERAS